MVLPHRLLLFLSIPSFSFHQSGLIGWIYFTSVVERPRPRVIMILLTMKYHHIEAKFDATTDDTYCFLPFARKKVLCTFELPQEIRLPFLAFPLVEVAVAVA